MKQYDTTFFWLTRYPTSRSPPKTNHHIFHHFREVQKKIIEHPQIIGKKKCEKFQVRNSPTFLPTKRLPLESYWLLMSKHDQRHLSPSRCSGIDPHLRDVTGEVGTRESCPKEISPRNSGEPSNSCTQMQLT